MGYFRLTFYYPVSDSFKDWNRLSSSGCLGRGVERGQKNRDDPA